MARVEIRKIIQTWKTGVQNYCRALFGCNLSAGQRLKKLAPFFINTVGLATFAAFILYAAPNQSLSNKATITLIVAILLLLPFISGLPNKQQKWRREIWEAVGLLAVAMATLTLILMAVGFKEGIPGLGGTALLLMMSAPAVLLYWKVAGDSLILKVWFVPMAALTSITLFSPQTLTRELLDFVAAPFMVASYGCALWVLFAKGVLVLLERAKKAKNSGECLQFRVHGMRSPKYVLASRAACFPHDAGGLYPPSRAHLGRGIGRGSKHVVRLCGVTTLWAATGQTTRPQIRTREVTETGFVLDFPAFGI